MKFFFLLIIMNIKRMMREWKKILLYFILPVVVFIGFFTYYKVTQVEINFINPIKVGVIIEDESIFGQMLVDDFQSKKELSEFFIIVQEEPSLLREHFEQHAIDALVTIPQGFVDALMTFDYLPIQVKMHQDDPVKTLILYQGFRGYEHYIQSVEKSITAFYEGFYEQTDSETYWKYNDALSIELIMTVLGRTELFRFDKQIDRPAAYSMDYYFLALSVLFIFYYALMFGISLITETRNNVFHRLMTTRVRVLNYLVSKLGVQVIGILTYLSVWTGLYILVTGRTSALKPKMFLAFFVLIVLASAVSMCLALFIRRENDFFMISTMAIFINAVLGGSILPIHFMPINLKTVAQFTPNYQSIKWMLFIATDTPYDHEIYVYVGLIIITILLIGISHTRLKSVLGGKS